MSEVAEENYESYDSILDVDGALMDAYVNHDKEHTGGLVRVFMDFLGIGDQSSSAQSPTFDQKLDL